MQSRKHRIAFAWLLAAAVVVVAPVAVAGETVKIVFAAPGYPGTHEQAAPSMATLATAVAAGSGGAVDAAEAAYHEIEDAGVAAIRSGADVAIVTLPFFLAHGRDLGLEIVAAASPTTPGRDESWTLVAARDAVKAPADLAGWELVSIAGYAPAFVRGPALGSWGPLPDDVRIVSTSRVLGALRRAAGGENVAVLLDGAQAQALENLPFAADLEVVARSTPMPTSLVCIRLDDGAARAVVDALLRLHDREDGRAALAEIRLDRFVAPPDAKTLETLVRAFEDAAQ